MKKIVTSILCLLAFGFAAYSGNRTEIDRLWKEYDRAVETDLPRKAEEILLKIKDKSRAEKLSYDFYRASVQYVSISVQRDWKTRNRLTEEMNADFRSYGDPVILYVSGLGLNRSDASECAGFLEKQAAELKRGRHSDFWVNVPAGYKGGALLPHIHNDFEYVLISMAFDRKLLKSAGYDKITAALNEVYPEVYPVRALHELFRIDGRDIDSYEKYAREYEGRATATLAKLNALPLKLRRLEESSTASGAEYRSLRKHCEEIVAEKSWFKGGEMLILKDENAAEEMIEELDSPKLEAEVCGRDIEIRLRNLSGVKISVYAGEAPEIENPGGKEQPVWMESIRNDAGSYYVFDTLRAELPELPDGNCVAIFESGKLKYGCPLTRHSIALSAVKSADGWLLYAADRMSGKPAGEVELAVENSDGEVLLRKKVIFREAVLLDSEIQNVLKSCGNQCRIQCSLTDADGFARCSEKLSLCIAEDSQTPEIDWQAVLLTDRSVCRPGETLNFKSIVYKDFRNGRMSTAPAGEKVVVTLADAENIEVRNIELTTNEYGSAAGRFDIPQGRRNGNWRISVSAGGDRLNSRWFTVDEFKLPEFSVSFARDAEKHFPGDEISFRGRVFSYAGNSLSDAKAGYMVTNWNGVVASGIAELDADGNFTVPVKTERGRDNCYTVTLSVTDGAGQTLEFRDWMRIDNRFGINAELKDAAEGGYISDRGDDIDSFDMFRRNAGFRKAVLKGNAARFDVNLADSGNGHIDGEINWTLNRCSEVLEKGECTSGKTLEIDFSGRPSGLYTVEFSKKYERTVLNETEEAAEATLKYELLKLDDDETALDADVENAFKVVESENEIALLFGAGRGGIWANVMLFDLDSRLLKNENIHLEGVRGENGSLRKIVWGYDSGWSDTVLLRVEYFKDGQHRLFEHTYQRSQTAFCLPLSVSTFTDSCLPGTEYRVTFSTEKSSELLAAVFDRSTEDIRSNVWRAVMPVFHSIYADSYFSAGCDFSGFAGERLFRRSISGNCRAPKTKSGLAAPAVSAFSAADAVVEAALLGSSAEEDGTAHLGFAEDGGSGRYDPEKVRKDFLSTLAFEPFIRSDAEGNAELRFRTSDRLSTYILSVFAHDRAFRNATLRREFVVSRPVTITLNAPSVLYGGDRCVFRPSVSNNSGKPVDGTLTVFVYDGDDSAQPVNVQNCYVALGKGESLSRDFAVTAPDAVSMKSYRRGRARLGIKAVFNAAGSGFSDAVLVSVPVLEGRQVITESHSAIFRSGTDKDSLVRDLESRFVNTMHPGATVRETKISGLLAETLADEAELRSDNILDVSEALYLKLIRENCRVRDGSETDDGNDNGDRNNALNGNGNDRGGNDSGNSDGNGTAVLVKKLLNCRCKDGGFAWFAGMSSSEVLTAVLLERLALLREEGRLPGGTDWDGILEGAVRYVDRQMFTERSGWDRFSRISTEQYAYLRSFFPEIAVNTKDMESEAGTGRFKEVVMEIKSFLHPSAKEDALNGRILEKARRSAAILNLVSADSDAFTSSLKINRAKMEKTLARNIESLKEYAVEHPSGGVYYPNAVMPFRVLLSSEAYAHSVICDMLTRWNEYLERTSGKPDARAAKIADGIRLWLMVQKESQQWRSNFEFINAVNSVRKGSPKLMETSVISLAKTYEKAFDEIKAAGNGFSITRQLLAEELVPSSVSGQEGTKVVKLRELRSGETLTVGQKIVVRYIITSDENRSLVHIRTPYNTCLRPVRQLSGNCGYALRKWRFNEAADGAGDRWSTPQGYREVHGSAVDYWIDTCPEQDSVIEDEFYVSQPGVFTAPVCEIESLYAPHCRANSAYSGCLTVK